METSSPHPDAYWRLGENTLIIDASPDPSSNAANDGSTPTQFITLTLLWCYAKILRTTWP